MIRRLATLALPLASLALAHTASAQTTTVAVAAPPPSGSVVVVAAPTNPDDVSRPGGSVAAVAGLGFLTGGGGAGFAFGVEGGYTFRAPPLRRRRLHLQSRWLQQLGLRAPGRVRARAHRRASDDDPAVPRPRLRELLGRLGRQPRGAIGNSLCEAEAGAILNSVSTSSVCASSSSRCRAPLLRHPALVRRRRRPLRHRRLRGLGLRDQPPGDPAVTVLTRRRSRDVRSASRIHRRPWDDLGALLRAR